MGVVTVSEEEGFLDREADALEKKLSSRPGLEKEIPSIEEPLFHAHQIAADREKLIDLEQKEVDGIEAGLQERTPATLPRVDLGAITKIDPQFDVEQFRDIARETFYKVKDARRREDSKESAPLLSDKMQ